MGVKTILAPLEAKVTQRVDAVIDSQVSCHGNYIGYHGDSCHVNVNPWLPW